MTTTYNISITVTGHDRASSPLGSVGRALGGIGTIAGGILAAGVLQRIGQAVYDMGRQALDSYASYERLGMALESLVARELVNSGAATNMAQALGMASETSKELLGWIEQLAIQSPFTSEDISAAFRQAMAYGFTADEAQRLTQAMVDFSAGSGATSDAMGRIALALGQIKARGHLAGQEINQLTEAGIPVRQILAEAFGVTTAELERMVSDGLIPADAAIEAITKSLEEDFGGAAARQATTFSGLISSLEDIKKVGLREFFTGTFEAIQPYVEDFVNTLSSPEFKANLKAMGAELGKFVQAGIEGFTKLRAMFTEMQNSPAMQTIVANIQKIFTTLNNPSILASAKQIFDGIKSFLTELGQKVLPFVISIFEKFGTWFEENGPLINEYVQLIADNFTNVFLPALMVVWDTIEPILSGIIDLVLNLVTLIMQVATGDWSGAWETIKQTVVGAGQAIWDAIVNLLDGIAGLFGGSLQEIGAIWSSNWEQFKQIVTTLGQSIMDGIAEGIQNGLTPLQAIVKSTVETIINFFKSLFGIASPSTIFAGFGQMLMEGLAQGIQLAGAVVTTAIQTAFATINTVVETALAGVGTIVETTFAGIGGIIGKAFDGVGTIVAGAVSAALTVAMTAAFIPVAAAATTSAGMIVAGTSAVFMTFPTALTPAFNNVTTYMVNKFNQIKARLIQQAKGFIAVGAAIIQGILVGLQQNSDQLRAYLEALIDEIIAETEASLGVASPSKVFAYFGEMMMAGMAQGIGRGANMTLRAMSNALASFGVGQAAARALSSYQNNATDNSQKYYAPIYVTVKNTSDLNETLKKLRSR